jgi:hypothetical protein
LIREQRDRAGVNARLASVVVALSCIAAPSLALADEGCPFLTDAEVEDVTGEDLLFELRSAALPDGPGTLCDSDIVRVILLPGEDGAARWDGFMKGAGRDLDQRFPIAGLGEDAYALHLDPRADNEYPTALVIVTSAAYTLAVSVRAKNGDAAVTAEPHAIELTKLAIPRIL